MNSKISTYKRILANEMYENLHFRVELVGYISDIKDECISILTGDKTKIILNNNSNDIKIDNFEKGNLIEVRGIVQNKSLIEIDEIVLLPNLKFNLELYEKSLEIVKNINFKKNN